MMLWDQPSLVSLHEGFRKKERRGLSSRRGHWGSGAWEYHQQTQVQWSSLQATLPNHYLLGSYSLLVAGMPAWQQLLGGGGRHLSSP